MLMTRECFFICVIGLSPENNGDTLTTAKQSNAEVQLDASRGMYGRASPSGSPFSFNTAGIPRADKPRGPGQRPGFQSPTNQKSSAEKL